MLMEKVAGIGAAVGAVGLAAAQAVPNPESLMGAAGKLTATAFLGLTCLGCLFLLHRGILASREEGVEQAKASARQAEAASRQADALHEVARAMQQQDSGFKAVAEELSKLAQRRRDGATGSG